MPESTYEKNLGALLLVEFVLNIGIKKHHCKTNTFVATFRI